MLRWQGPYEIIDVPSPLIRGIRILGKPDSDLITVHVSRIRMFADSKLNVTDTLIESTQHDARAFEVKDIVGHRIEDGKLELHHPVEYGWHGRASQRLPRERASRGNRERVITRCDLARANQL